MQTKFDIGQTVYTTNGTQVEISKITISNNEVFYYMVGGSCGFVESSLSADAPTPKNVYALKGGEEIWWIGLDGSVNSQPFLDEDNFDRCMVDQGNIFLTEQEAQTEAERREIRQIMRKHGGCDKTRSSYEWAIGWAPKMYDEGSVIDIGYADTMEFTPLGGIFFLNQKEAKAALEEIGEYRFRKAFVEE